MNTEEKILKAALTLFVDKGFNASTSEITRKAGVSSGILFHYFTTKDELILALYSNILLEYYQAGFSFLDEGMMEDPGAFDASLKKAWFAQVEWGINHWEKFEYLQQFDNTPYAEKYEPRHDPKVRQIREALVQYTRAAIGKGISKDMPHEFLISNGAALTVSMIRHLHADPKMKRNRDFWEKAFQIYRCAIMR